jgi:hypothetical protein
MTDPGETADLVGESTEAWREHEAEEAAGRPVTYNEASGGNIADQVDRYRELAEHDTMVRSIAILKARGTYEPDERVNDEKFPPLSMAEHLEMLALGERMGPLLPASGAGGRGGQGRGDLGADRRRRRDHGGRRPGRLPRVGRRPAPALRGPGHRPGR